MRRASQRPSLAVAGISAIVSDTDGQQDARQLAVDEAVAERQRQDDEGEFAAGRQQCRRFDRGRPCDAEEAGEPVDDADLQYEQAARRREDRGRDRKTAT